MRAASRMRSCVRWGMDFAAGERLITRETVAGDRSRYAARDLRLTDCAETLPREGEDATVFGLDMGVCGRSLPQAAQGSKREGEDFCVF